MRSVLAIVGILLLVGCDLRGESQRRSMEKNLKQIELAIKNYEQSYRKVDYPNQPGGVVAGDSGSPPK
jgi:hypothetical protein